MTCLWSLKSIAQGSCIRRACFSEVFLQAGILNMRSEAWSNVNEKESFIGVIYSNIAFCEGTSTSHLIASRQEHRRHMGICSFLKDLGGPGFFHNSFQSLNTLASGNSSLYLTYRPPSAVNTHFRFFSVSSRDGEQLALVLCVLTLHQRQKVIWVSLGCFSQLPATKSLN